MNDAVSCYLKKKDREDLEKVEKLSTIFCRI